MLNHDHPLSTLILSLRSDLSDAQIDQLCATMGSEECPWEVLLGLANLHRVTLLWYLCLQQHELTAVMPEDLSAYLDALLDENRARNANMMAALLRCLNAFEQEGIECILLKGAAALADGLYGDPGARLMGDLDLLVRAEQLEAASQALAGLGFIMAEADRDNPFYESHHHLPPFHHPQLQVCLELHAGITDFSGSRSFAPERLFARATTVTYDGYAMTVLQRSDRLIHNACHAMVQDAGWLHSWCSMHEWLEWDRLLRNSDTVEFEVIHALAEEGGFACQLKVYSLIANQLLGSTVPDEWQSPDTVGNVERLLAGLAWRGTSACEPAMVRRHYLLHILPHTWRSHHLNRQQVPLLRRLVYFVKLALQPRSWDRLR